LAVILTQRRRVRDFNRGLSDAFLAYKELTQVRGHLEEAQAGQKNGTRWLKTGKRFKNKEKKNFWDCKKFYGNI
jgi:hypothetical protein